MLLVSIKLRNVGHPLGTRLLGEAVRKMIEDARAQNLGADIELDFSGVDMITASFAHRQSPNCPRKKRDRSTKLSLTNYTVAAVLAYVLRRRRH